MDVAINAGEEFCVETYVEMSEKVKKRTDVLLDMEQHFGRLWRNMIGEKQDNSVPAGIRIQYKC